mmetsp:Transcript_38260/g.113733  ORF Transcript_38260/g.113733 Transcript_38260/m.113733 type:complete len:239 (-) Transcript_38260:139-855(-)
MSPSWSCGALTRPASSRATLYGSSYEERTVPHDHLTLPEGSRPTLHCTRAPGSKRSRPAGGTRSSSGSCPSASILSRARKRARCASVKTDSPQPPGQPGRSQLACSATESRSSRNASNSSSTPAHSPSDSRFVRRMRKSRSISRVAFQMASRDAHARCISRLTASWCASDTSGEPRFMPLSFSAAASYASMSAVGSSTPSPRAIHSSGSCASGSGGRPNGLAESTSLRANGPRPARWR